MGSGKWMGMLLVAATTACGGHSVRDNPGGAADSSPTVDPAPTEPTPSNNPGPVDEPTPIDVPEPDDPVPPQMNTPKPLPVPCEYESLDVVCSSSDCVVSPNSFGDACAKGLSVSKASTACGGSVVVIAYSFGQTSYFFDAAGTLTGVVSVGDVEEVCANGHQTNARVYGSVCQTSGILLDVCPSSVKCGVPYMCIPGPTCPLHSADVLSNYCPDPTTEVVRAWATTCGGSALIVSHTDGAQVRYCYDAQDMLSGISTLDGLAWVFVGTDCETLGQSSLPCVPK